MRLNLGIRRRLAPLLDNDRRRIELMNGMLMSLPGTPIIYYGDEIGMGDNVYLGDRNGVRTPMQWDGGWNGGFSTADPEMLYSPLMLNPVYGYQAINVQSQKRVRPLAAIVDEATDSVRRSRLRFWARFNRVSVSCESSGAGLCAASWGTRRFLSVNNLSSAAQAVELDLKAYRGNILIEMFGRNIFPRVGDLPYLLTLGPYQFYWFRLRRV